MTDDMTDDRFRADRLDPARGESLPEGLRAIGFFDRPGPENVYRRGEEGKEDLESRCA